MAHALTPPGPPFSCHPLKHAFLVATSKMTPAVIPLYLLSLFYFSAHKLQIFISLLFIFLFRMWALWDQGHQFIPTVWGPRIMYDTQWYQYTVVKERMAQMSSVSSRSFKAMLLGKYLVWGRAWVASYCTSWVGWLFVSGQYSGLRLGK